MRSEIAPSRRPVKRSLTLKGHRTSVSLEEEFWQVFRQLAAEDGRALNDLASEIDADRGLSMGLASAIRLFVLKRLQERLAASPGREP